MHRIQPLAKVDPAAYDAFVASHPHSSAYHKRAWLHILQQTYGYAPASLIAQDENERITGILPLMRVSGRLKGRRLVSLPFSHCVPILVRDEAVRTALLDAAVAMTQDEGYAYLELKLPESPRHDAFQSSTLNFTSELSLQPETDALFAAFPKANRRNIRNGEQSDFRLRTGESLADFESFYELEISTRHRQGAPIYPPRFFRLLFEHMKPQVNLYLGSLHGQDVAGILILHMGERAIYAYGASLRSTELNRISPGNVLVWRAIQDAKAAGYRIFDFGTTPLHLENLLTFKQHFRPQTFELPCWYFLNSREQLPIIKRDSASAKLVEGVLRLLPRPLFWRFSSMLLREVG